MKLSRSTYYYQVKRLTQGDNNKELKEAIQDIYSENKGRYGYRRIHLELKNRGYKVNHKKVQREKATLFCTTFIKCFLGN
ncbi:transposase for insertion sequence element IS986/IS6110 [Streptococcus dysgalactiae subsp. dysgalactiae]|uniref:Transposase for insertion sequence element IS986/IS6110 n=1 Tax=Streptococcus dysgalactiae subsp. dysgalactiae TaxID=99822 RepID=A0A380JTT7_STRDY|nr:transposase for insertion sequence element IS986/IS6110 [Streptococcus dysgalactiae subsp. dysgalactiae]